MSNLDIAITQEMVNQYHLYIQTQGAKKENLYRLWEKELKHGLDKTQRKWIEQCMTGKRKMNIISRHGRNFISQQQMLMGDEQFTRKGLTHTLNELPAKDYSRIQKSLKG